MLIVCPNCQASYRVSSESLGTSGRTVRCAKCQTAWFADSDSAEDSPLDDDASTALTTMSDDDTGEPPTARLAAALARLDSDVTDVDPPPPPAQRRLALLARRLPRRGKATARRAPEPREPIKPVTIAAMAGLAAIALLILGRTEVVRLFPQTAMLYAAIGLDVNVRGLAFKGVDASERVEGGVAILLVSGTIENLTDKLLDVPRVRLAVLNMEGQELYVWTVVPRRNQLAAGDSLPFQAQLAAPPAEARDIAVRFLARHDAIAGIQ
jgi:predicted Zn finger-like uncharacterized protein